ncbi:DUF5677 domain-containing protein [Pseudomonas caspiana]
MDGNAINKSLNERGFLSPAIEFVQAQYRREYSQAFSEVEELSDIAQTLMMAAGIRRNEIHMLTSLVFLQRAIRNCQAAIILCERGLVVEAQTLTRTALEVTFYAAALIKDASVYLKIEREGNIAERKQANGIIQSGSSVGLTEDHLDALQPVIQRGEGNGAGFTAYEAARVAGLLPFYETIYRGFSGTASHATLRSLDSSFVETEDGLSLVSGPTTYHLEFTLGILKTCLALPMQLLRENFEFDDLSSHIG